MNIYIYMYIYIYIYVCVYIYYGFLTAVMDLSVFRL